MSNMEFEVKVLNIDKQKLIDKIKELGGEYVSSSSQYLCVYDLEYSANARNRNRSKFV